MNHLSWRVYFIVAAWVLVVWLALRSSLAAEPAQARYFPLEKGNYWVYRGETTWSPVSTDRRRKAEPKSAVLTWRMEVVDTLSGNGWQAALLKGFPGDLAWYEPGIPRGDHLILQLDGGSYYLFHETDAREIWTQLKSGKPLHAGVTTAESLFFTAPLTRGRVYGGSRQNIKRCLYCWSVKSERPFDPRQYPPGAVPTPAIQPARVFTLVYATSPDSTTVDFVPGLGIVGYQYRHHGTPAETNLSLIEFGTSAPKPKTPATPPESTPTPTPKSTPTPAPTSKSTPQESPSPSQERESPREEG